MSETSATQSDSEARAPGELELVRAFVNTRELDPEHEHLGDGTALEIWMGRHDIPAGGGLTDADAERARSFREAIRALLLANNGDPLAAGAVSKLRAAAGSAPIQVQVGDDGSLVVAPGAAGVAGLVARVLAIAAAAQETREWQRLKACVADDCVWAFYDRSRNRSRHWCSMEGCGNRAKTRAYRAKRRAAKAR